METLRHQLQAREAANQQTQPTGSSTYRYRVPIDTPSTPMLGSRATGETLHSPKYYHMGSAADPGYYDPMRNAMSGSDLLA